MYHLLGLYEIKLGFEWLNGHITDGQYNYRRQKARKLAKQIREQHEAQACNSINREDVYDGIK
jgi:hypothetical protein